MPKQKQRTYAQIMNQIAVLQAEAETARLREREGVISRIREGMKHYNITPKDLMDQPKTKKVIPQKAKVGFTVKPKYINGSLKWTGRGSAPRWIRDHENNGGSRDDFLIKKE